MNKISFVYIHNITHAYSDASCRNNNLGVDLIKSLRGWVRLVRGSAQGDGIVEQHGTHYWPSA